MEDDYPRAFKDIKCGLRRNLLATIICIVISVIQCVWCQRNVISSLHATYNVRVTRTLSSLQSFLSDTAHSFILHNNRIHPPTFNEVTLQANSSDYEYFF